MAWDYPVFIVATFVVALAIAIWLIRAANPAGRKPFFRCVVCGRVDKAASSRNWRYCPNCGTPRDAKRSTPMRAISSPGDEKDESR